MKPVSIVSLAVLCAAAVAVLTLRGQPRESSPVREFMREKLDHAQSVLEGISLENYELIAAHAIKLRAMSDAASWQAFKNPEYVQQSAVFRRNVDGLIKAARERNLDGATLAYTKVTFSCVECHKYIRGREAAFVPKLHPVPAAGKPARS